MKLERKHLLILAAIVGTIGALAIAFLAGYVPEHLRARRAMEAASESSQRVAEVQAELARTQFDLEIARLRGSLGELFHEANANNFGNAAALATPFFDGARGALDSPTLSAESERRRVLETVLARRDEISADLARADPGVRAKLADMYMQLGTATKP